MKKILFFNNSAAHFFDHLFPIAKAAAEAGYKISLLTELADFNPPRTLINIKIIPIRLKRKSINPFNEIRTIYKVIKILRQEKPEILHSFTIKPIVYGSIATWFTSRKIKLINTFLGLGYVFISNKLIYALIRKLICFILSLHSRFKPTLYIVQNKDDKILLERYNIAPDKKIINQCSVGVDTKLLPLYEEKKGPIVFALIGRMLRDKGVYEFIGAARLLKEKSINAEFWLVGKPDKDNPSSIDLSELITYHNKGIIKYKGFQNILEIWEKAHVAVLPSYREGLSRSLLEAGACGKAIITTDAPGGRELIKHKKDGLLIKPKDSGSLAAAMELLVKDENLRRKLGINIRALIVEKYESKILASKMINLYNKVQ